MSKLDEKEILEIESELDSYWDGEYIDVDRANKIASYCNILLNTLKIADSTIQAISDTYNGEGTDIQVARKMVKLADSYLIGVEIK